MLCDRDSYRCEENYALARKADQAPQRHYCTFLIFQLAAIESRVAYPEKTFDDGYLEMFYGMVCLPVTPEIPLF